MITLKTLPAASKQEIFDQVSQHLLKQNAQSIKTYDSGYNMCAYRGNDGTKCAAGVLISDTEYTENMDGNTWIELVEKGIVPRENVYLIRCLQTLHDLEQPSLWKEGLEDIAEQHNLKCNF